MPPLEALGQVSRPHVSVALGLDEPHSLLDGGERLVQVPGPVLVVHGQLAPAFHLARLPRLGPEGRGAIVFPSPLGAPGEAQ